MSGTCKKICASNLEKMLRIYPLKNRLHSFATPDEGIFLSLTYLLAE